MGHGIHKSDQFYSIYMSLTAIEKGKTIDIEQR